MTAAAAKLRVTEVSALFVVAGPCLLLALKNGGVSEPAQTLAHSWILGGLALWWTRQWSLREAVLAPRWGLLLAWWPLAQMMPLPAAVLAAIAPGRAAELTQFALQGVRAPATITLYPYMTGRAVLMFAGTVALFVLARETVRKRPTVVFWVAGALLAGAMIEAALGFRQYLEAQAGARLGWGPRDIQARGSFGNRNLLAAWLEGCAGLALGVAGAGRSGGLIWGGIVAVAAALGVVVTFSRLGLVGLCAVVTIFLALGLRGRRRWWAAMAPAVLLAVALGAAGWPGLTQRFGPEALEAEREGRLAMWRDSLKAVQKYGWTGAGVGAFPYAFRRSGPYLADYTIDHPHNDYLETVVEWGLPATLLLGAWGAAAGLRLLRRLGRAAESHRRLGLGCLAGVAGILMHGLGDFPLRIPAILALTAVLLGLTAGLAAEGRPPRRSPRLVTALCLAGVVLALVSTWRPAWGNAETHYRESRRLVEAGRLEDAQGACRRGLEANPYAAALWLERAWIAEARGSREAAAGYLETALTLEPHTRRTVWAAANGRMRLGEPEAAAPLLAEVAGSSPLWRPAAFQAWRAAGLPEATLLEALSKAETRRSPGPSRGSPESGAR